MAKRVLALSVLLTGAVIFFGCSSKSREVASVDRDETTKTESEPRWPTLEPPQVPKPSPPSTSSVPSPPPIASEPDSPTVGPEKAGDPLMPEPPDPAGEMPDPSVAKTPDPVAEALPEPVEADLTAYRPVRRFVVPREGNCLVTCRPARTVPKAPEKSTDSVLTVWDLASGKERSSIESPKVFDGLVISPNGKYLATTSSDPEKVNRVVDFWEVATGRHLRQLTEMSGTLVGFSSNARKLIIARNEYDITVYDIAQDKHDTWKLPETGPGFGIRCLPVACSPSEAAIAIARFDLAKGKAVVDVRDIENRKVLKSLGPSGTHPVGLAYSADGGTLALSTLDGKLVVWDTSTWKPRATFDRAEIGQPQGAACFYQWLAVSPNGSRIVGYPINSGELPKLEIWDVESGEMRVVEAPRASIPFAFLPNGNLAAVLSGYETLAICDPSTGQQLLAPFAPDE